MDFYTEINLYPSNDYVTSFDSRNPINNRLSYCDHRNKKFFPLRSPYKCSPCSTLLLSFLVLLRKYSISCGF